MVQPLKRPLFLKITIVICVLILLMGQVCVFAAKEPPRRFILTPEEQAYLEKLRVRPIEIAYTYELAQAEFGGKKYGLLEPVLDILRNELDLNVKMVKTSSYDIFNMIENGDVDFYGPIAISESRRAEYITVEPFYRSYSKIITRIDNPIHSMMGLYNHSLGLLEGSLISRTTQVYLGSNGTTIYYPTMEAMIEGLKTGEIDAFATAENAEFEILRHNDIQFEFSIDNSSVDQGLLSGREDMRQLASILNRYLNENPQISEETTKIRRQALIRYNREQFATELAYLRANYNAVTMYSDMILYPLCYSEDGTIKGMQLEINEIFEEVTGVKIRFDVDGNYPAGIVSVMERLKTGECMAYVGAYNDISTWKDPTVEYSPLVWLETMRTYTYKSASENLSGKAIGAIRFASDYLVWHNLTGKPPIIYNNRDELIDALKNGDVDAVFMGEMGFNYGYSVLKDYSLREVTGISAEAPMHMLYGTQNKEFNSLYNSAITLFNILNPQSLGQWKAQSDKYKSDYIRIRFNQQIITTIVIISFIVMILALLYLFVRNLQAHKHTRTILAEVDEKRRTILDSINYASRIQQNLLPDDNIFKESFMDYSIIWKPRDIVGGDIYWIKKFDKGTILCVCDCTGHGTPGAFLSMLVVSAFEATVDESNYKDTAGVIWNLEQRLVSVLGMKQDEGNLSTIKDGCDLAVIYISQDGNVTISSANIHVFVCDGKEVKKIKGQKIFIGEGKLKRKEDVRTIELPANPDNKFYIASDGLYDQIGGSHALPFGYKTFKKLILNNHNDKQSVIAEKVWEAFENYRGDQVRRDDFELITFKP